MIAVVACHCGSSESLARNFLKSVGYPGWMDITIHRGKENSMSILNQLPPAPEKEMLKNFLSNASKWVVIIGYDDSSMRWSDITHGGAKTKIEAEMVVKNFSEDYK